MLISSDEISNPAKHAVIRHTTTPTRKDLNTTLLIAPRLFGINVYMAETIMDMDPGLAKPHIA